MFDAWPVHPKGTMVIPMHWRICGYVSCCMRVGSENGERRIRLRHVLELLLPRGARVGVKFEGISA
jgi:hypothetical protein